MTRIIGSIVMALFLIAIPILATLSWAYDWFDFIKFVLCVCTFAEFVGLTSAIYSNAE